MTQFAIHMNLSDFDGKSFPKSIEHEGQTYLYHDGRGDSAQYNLDIEGLIQARENAEKELTALQSAIGEALEELSPYLNANSPYTPDVLSAASILQKALDGETAPAPEELAREFQDGQKVMVATHGIDATFFHEAVIEDAILGKDFGGKRAWLYAIRYINGVLRIDVGKHDIKPIP